MTELRTNLNLGLFYAFKKKMHPCIILASNFSGGYTSGTLKKIKKQSTLNTIKQIWCHF